MNKNIFCNICGKNNYKLLFKAKDLLYRTTEEEFQIVRCMNCGLVYINPQPEDMGQYYPESYAPHNVDMNIKVNPSLIKTLELFYGYSQKRLDSIDKIKFIPKYLEVTLKNNYFFYRIPYGSDKKLLDIGCGNGGYLLKLKRLGWDAETQLYGVELPNSALKKLKENERLNIIEGDFMKVDLPENYFDIVTLRHVLEHLSDPLGAMKKVYDILKSDGLVLINAPNFKSVEAFLFKGKYHNIDAPRHLFHFTPESLGKLLDKVGFHVEKLYLKKSPTPFVASLKNYGYHVPKYIKKYVISNMLTVFKLLGFSGEFLCKAYKKDTGRQ